MSLGIPISGVSCAGEQQRCGRPWLSVVMASWCGEQWIAAALELIAAEAASGIEVLLLDSSPTPTTAEIAQRYADRLDLQVFARPDLPAWQAKTNHGVAIAAADHVCWLHQDDLWLPGRAAAVREWIAAAPDTALHLAPSVIVDRDGASLGLWRCPLPASRELDAATVTRRLLVQNFIAAPAPVFRKQAWLDCGGMDEQLWYTGDWDVWLKLAAAGPVITTIRSPPVSASTEARQTIAGIRDLADFEQQMRIVLDRHLPRLAGERSVERAARTSILVNTALATAAAGSMDPLWQAIAGFACLGPVGLYRYLRDLRIRERLVRVCGPA